MHKQLLLFAAIGAVIGLALPSPREDAPARQTQIADRAGPVEAGEEEGWGGETRLKRRGNGHFYTLATVNGELVEFVVDTGATSVALTIDDAERAGIEVDRGRFDVIGTGASGPVRGQLFRIESIEIDGKEVRNVEGAVAEGLEQSLLGQSYLSRIGGVEMSGEHMILR